MTSLSSFVLSRHEILMGCISGQPFLCCLVIEKKRFTMKKASALKFSRQVAFQHMHIKKTLYDCREYEMLNPPGSLLRFQHPISPLLSFREKKNLLPPYQKHQRKSFRRRSGSHCGLNALLTTNVIHKVTHNTANVHVQ